MRLRATLLATSVAFGLSLSLPALAQETAMPPVTSADHLRGNPDARITLVEYTDFQCPYCKRHLHTMKTLLKKYKGEVSWVYRPFPLSFHPYALPAAEAAECVADMGINDQFWLFHDRVYRLQARRNAMTSQIIAQIERLGAATAGEKAVFMDCIRSDRHLKKIQTMMDAGSAAGVNGTPATFIVDNKTGKVELVSGAMPLPAFMEKIDAILKK
jgi:protein-disulfide isomerase